MKTMRRGLIAFALSLALVSQANAGAVIGATEPTQILNNIQLVESYIKQVEMARNTLQSAAELKQQLKQLDSGTLSSLTGDSIGDVQQMASLYDQLGRVMDSSQQSADVLRRAEAEMEAQHLTPQEYLQERADLARTQGGMYAKSYQTDQQKLQNMQSDIAQLNQSASAAQGVTSNIQGFQQLLASGTRVQAQLVQINASVTQANALAAQRAQAEAADAQHKADAEKAYMDQRTTGLKKASSTTISVPSPINYTNLPDKGSSGH